MRSARLAAVLDVGCVLVFVIIGRDSHAKGESLAGIASTAWPFLAGLAGGWNAFITIGGGFLTVLGALLPFAAVAALVGVPAWQIVKRRRGQRAAPPLPDSPAA